LLTALYKLSVLLTYLLTDVILILSHLPVDIGYRVPLGAIDIAKDSNELQAISIYEVFSIDQLI